MAEPTKVGKVNADELLRVLELYCQYGSNPLNILRSVSSLGRADQQLLWSLIRRGKPERVARWTAEANSGDGFMR